VAAFEAGVARCLRQGSELLCGGSVLGGNFVEPTLLRAPGFNHIATESELFSPVAHLVRYKEGEIDRVVADINRTGYGLSGGVFTADAALFDDIVTRVRVGILNLNYGSSGAEAGENFGGEGRTGGGRQMGPAMFASYTRFVNSMRAPAGSPVVHAQGVTQS
jgi:acyl-CoA reductase-like NAD-dependent aldehyde dehydrogenase